MFARALIFCIRIYQRLSRYTPRICRFTPTCSQYTIRALQLHGFWRGIALGIARVCRCNPFNPGGYDPVPDDPMAECNDDSHIHSETDDTERS
ncbi:MAG: membrane protein insertion efficiency factor YidD [Armatimonadota bacterium]